MQMEHELYEGDEDLERGEIGGWRNDGFISDYTSPEIRVLKKVC